MSFLRPKQTVHIGAEEGSPSTATLKLRCGRTDPITSPFCHPRCPKILKKKEESGCTVLQECPRNMVKVKHRKQARSYCLRIDFSLRGLRTKTSLTTLLQAENWEVTWPSEHTHTHTPLLPPCQLHLVDPAHRVGPGVQGGLSLRRDPSLQLGPRTRSQSQVIFHLMLCVINTGWRLI